MCVLHFFLEIGYLVTHKIWLRCKHIPLENAPIRNTCDVHLIHIDAPTGRDKLLIILFF